METIQVIHKSIAYQNQSSKSPTKIFYFFFQKFQLEENQYVNQDMQPKSQVMLTVLGI